MDIEIDKFLKEKFLGLEQERFIIAYRHYIECENRLEEERFNDVVAKEREWTNAKFAEQGVEACNTFFHSKTQMMRETIAFRQKEFFDSYPKEIIEFQIPKGTKRVHRFLVKRKSKLSINSIFCPLYEGTNWIKKLDTKKPFYVLTSYNSNRGFKLTNIYTGKTTYLELDKLDQQKVLYGEIKFLQSDFKALALYHQNNFLGNKPRLLYDPTQEPPPKPKKAEKKVKKPRPQSSSSSSTPSGPIKTYFSKTYKRELLGITPPLNEQHVEVLKSVYDDAYGLNTCSFCNQKKCRIHMVLNKNGQLMCFTCNGSQNSFKAWTYTPNEQQRTALRLDQLDNKQKKLYPVSMYGDDSAIRQLMHSTSIDNEIIQRKSWSVWKKEYGEQ